MLKDILFPAMIKETKMKLMEEALEGVKKVGCGLFFHLILSQSVNYFFFYFLLTPKTKVIFLKLSFVNLIKVTFTEMCIQAAWIPEQARLQDRGKGRR